MVHFKRTFPAPACLEQEFLKPNGDYRCKGVATQLYADFKNKCYLCEQLGPTSINIEHLREHRGNKLLKFAWKNLYYACAHCNNTKEAKASGQRILDCMNPDHQVDSCLSYRFATFPQESELVIAVEVHRPRAANTAGLLNAIFHGHTEQKQIEAANLRQKLSAELTAFRRLVLDYTKSDPADPRKERFRRSIISHLQNSSAFTAFKRWIIRDHPALMAEFGQYLDDLPA